MSGGGGGIIIIKRIKQVLGTKFTETQPVKVWHALIAALVLGVIAGALAF